MAPRICAYLIQILLNKQSELHITTVVKGKGCGGGGHTTKARIEYRNPHGLWDSGILGCYTE